MTVNECVKPTSRSISRTTGNGNFFPVAKVNGRPKPELVLPDGKAIKGTSALSIFSDAKMASAELVRSGPRYARRSTRSFRREFSLARLSKPEGVTPKTVRSTTIRAAVGAHLSEVNATKIDARWRAYPADLARFDGTASVECPLLRWARR